jgi:cyanophycinase
MCKGEDVAAGRTTPGVLALVGGDEWTPGCEFDAELLAASGTCRVLVLPTAAAFERPERRVLAAAEWFAQWGGEVEGLMVTSRADAQDDGAAAIVAAARFVYLSGGSPLHLRSVLKDSKVFAALCEAWRDGAVVAGAGAGALVLSDPMVDPRGGALTVGLGLVGEMAVVPLAGNLLDDIHGEKLHRSVLLAPPGVAVVGVPGRTAVIRDADGAWRSAGQGMPQVYVDGAPAPGGLAVLAGR